MSKVAMCVVTIFMGGGLSRHGDGQETGRQRTGLESDVHMIKVP